MQLIFLNEVITSNDRTFYCPITHDANLYIGASTMIDTTIRTSYLTIIASNVLREMRHVIPARLEWT